MSRYTRFPAGGAAAAGPMPAAWRRPPPAEPAPAIDPAADPRPDPAGDSGPGARRSRPAAAREARAGAPSAEAAAHMRLSLVVTLFLFALVMPFSFKVGPLVLTPARLVLLVLIVPLVIGWLGGACGRKRLADWLLVAYLAWQTISWINWGGFAWTEYAGVLVIESFGAYLLARRFVRDEATYLGVIRVFMILGVVLGAAAMIEATTGRRLLTMLFEPFFRIYPTNVDYRMNMQRAQTSFEHPILSGLFILMMFAPLWTALRVRGSWIRALIGALPVAAGVFFSLSTGALLGLTVQMGILAWGAALKSKPWRWKLLAALTVAAYVSVDLLSNRTPFEVFITYATFNQGTGYHRILIFIYGLEHVWINPILGSGFDDWARPDWLHSSSVDNFWLAMAMRHGVPGFALIFGFYVCSILTLIRARPASRAIRAHREGIAIMLVALFLSLCTVHVWSSTFTFMMFMLGLHGWVSDAPRADAGAGAAEEEPASARGVRTASGAARRAPGRPASDRSPRAGGRRPSRS